MIDVNFIDLDVVLKIHDAMVGLYGGSFGVRDQKLLESALFQPQLMFGGNFVHQDICLMAGAYLFHLIKNHPFVDGNKRTAVATAIIFLQMNEYAMTLGDQ